MNPVAPVSQEEAMAALDTPVEIEVDDSVRPVDPETELTVDFSDMNLDELWEEGRYPLRITKITPKTSKNGGSYLQFDLMVIAGQCKSKFIEDRGMLTGAGRKHTLYLFAALGLATGGDTLKCKYGDLLEKDVWGTVVNQDDKLRPGKKRSVIAFDGYEPIETRPLPLDNDPFANPGEVGGNPFEEA